MIDVKSLQVISVLDNNSMLHPSIVAVVNAPLLSYTVTCSANDPTTGSVTSMWCAEKQACTSKKKKNQRSIFASTQKN